MKRRMMVLLTATVACGARPREGGDERGVVTGAVDAQARPALSFTHWTEESELFVELPALVRGQPSPCAAHLTRLQDFAPLSEGHVSVVLTSASSEERFEVQAATAAGIFRPIALPATAGQRRLKVEVRAPGLSADHDLGEVTVFESAAAARSALPVEAEAPGRIVFLKEQQWAMDFGTAVVAERTLRPSLRAMGTIVPRSDGEVRIIAPVAGRVATALAPFPRLGSRVVVNDLLGVLAPRLEAADLASLELAVASADLELRFAQRERVRLETLRGEGAVPERRVQDAAHVADEAQAALAAAQRRLEQFRRVQQTRGRAEGTLELRAPLSGTVTEVLVAPGTFVEAGSPLLRVTDLTQLWLEVHVPEADLDKLGTPRGASFTVQGQGDAIELPPAALIARGSYLDPRTKTLSVLFSVDNAGERLPVGALAEVLLMTGEERQALSIPRAALVDDSGSFVAFVQVEGEALERRALRLGLRDRGHVEVLSGLAAGEHVVTRGAWSVKLAASSGAIPAHGHSH